MMSLLSRIWFLVLEILKPVMKINLRKQFHKCLIVTACLNPIKVNVTQVYA